MKKKLLTSHKFDTGSYMNSAAFQTAAQQYMPQMQSLENLSGGTGTNGATGGSGNVNPAGMIFSEASKQLMPLVDALAPQRDSELDSLVLGDESSNQLGRLMSNITGKTQRQIRDNINSNVFQSEAKTTQGLLDDWDSVNILKPYDTSSIDGSFGKSVASNFMGAPWLRWWDKDNPVDYGNLRAGLEGMQTAANTGAGAWSWTGAVVGDWISKANNLFKEKNAHLANNLIKQNTLDNMARYNNAADNINKQNKFSQLGSLMAEGGPLLQDFFNNGVTQINEGKTHEENPYEGVQIGIAPDGKPNLVEEGEIIYNDYVYSNRLKVPKAVRNKYKLRNGSFADSLRPFTKDLEERPNDPITRNGFNWAAGLLAQTQEQVRNIKSNNSFANGGHIFDGKTEKNQIILHDKSKKDNYFKNLYAEDSNYMKAINWLKEQANAEYLTQLMNDITAGKYDTDIEKINGVNIDNSNWERLALDYKKGPVHNALMKLAEAAPWEATTPQPAPVIPEDTPSNMLTPEDIFDLEQQEANEDEETSGIPEVTPSGTKVTPKVNPEDLKRFNPWNLRYADLAGNFGAVLGDMLGLTNTPTVFNEVGPFREAGYKPIGNYLPYNPFDTRYALNQEMAQAAATRRALMQNNSPSMAANIIANDYNTLGKIGELYATAQEYNNKQRQAVEEFNRATNIQNANAYNQTELANAGNKLRYDQLRLSQAQLNDAAETAAYQAKSANLNNLRKASADALREYVDRDRLTGLAQTGVFDILSNVMKNDPALLQRIFNDSSKACGGKIKRKKKLLTH